MRQSKEQLPSLLIVHDSCHETLARYKPCIKEQINMESIIGPFDSNVDEESIIPNYIVNINIRCYR